MDTNQPLRDPARAISALPNVLDAIIVDIGGTLVSEQPPTTSVNDLHPTLLHSVREDLQLLKSYVRLGAATNTSVMREHDVRRLLALAGIDDYLEVVVTSVDVGAAKPDPRVLHEVLKRLALPSAERALYVGDRDTDEEAALRAGMPFAKIREEGLLATVTHWLNPG
ncbi:MAG: HAD-IA family hydrolase [Acidimicrobiales bacterium]